jgi:hypothetical protein
MEIIADFCDSPTKRVYTKYKNAKRLMRKHLVHIITIRL